MSHRRKLVVGMGSNCVDLFYPLRRFPAAGDKEYFSSVNICTGKLVGGVTLNHLAWARALGCPTSLLALQGNDENGVMIRKQLKDLGVDTQNIKVSDDYSTSVSHILSSPDGERTIMMAPASTSLLHHDRMKKEFGPVVSQSAAMCSTEISQVPLSGVRYLLEASKEAGIPSLLDVDITPEIALGSAQLGSKEDLVAVVSSAKVIKLTAGAAGELLALVHPTAKLDGSLDGMAKQLAEAFKASLCVVTSGSRGSAFALGQASKVEPVSIPLIPGIKQVDATGAGDAHFGSMIACLYQYGLPKTREDLNRIGKIASAAGAACVEVQGALPILGRSAKRVLELCKESQPLIDAAKAFDKDMLLAAVGSSAGGAALPSSTVGSSFEDSIAKDASALADLKAIKQETAHVEKVVSLLAAAHTTCIGTATTSSSARHVYVTGVGKSGCVASRMASSLRSIGVRASYIAGPDWSHGDLGTASLDDVLVCFSHSGKTSELVDVCRRGRGIGCHVISITGNPSSPLAQESDAHLFAKADNELLGLIPTRSIVSQEALINGILTAVAQKIGYSRKDFENSHPGGTIGQEAFCRE